MKIKPFEYQNLKDLEIKELKLELKAVKDELEATKKDVDLLEKERNQLILDNAGSSIMVNMLAAKMEKEAI